MIKTKYQIILCVFFSLVTNLSYADKEKIAELTIQCEQARQEKIEPLRQQAIKECIEKDKNDRDAKEKCERFYVDYGAGARFKSGGHKERMFNDLPECVALNKAEVKSMNDVSR